MLVAQGTASFPDLKLHFEPRQYRWSSIFIRRPVHETERKWSLVDISDLIQAVLAQRSAGLCCCCKCFPDWVMEATNCCLLVTWVLLAHNCWPSVADAESSLERSKPCRSWRNRKSYPDTTPWKSASLNAETTNPWSSIPDDVAVATPCEADPPSLDTLPCGCTLLSSFLSYSPWSCLRPLSITEPSSCLL